MKRAKDILKKCITSKVLIQGKMYILESEAMTALNTCIEQLKEPEVKPILVTRPCPKCGGVKQVQSGCTTKKCDNCDKDGRVQELIY